MQSMRKIKNNQGSITVEMTLLIPFVLGIIFMYIMYLLFSIQTARSMYQQMEIIYEKEDESAIVLNRESLDFNLFHSKEYKAEIELKVYEKNPITSIRRWQLAAGAIS